jgi:hypothetical protein
VYGLHGLAVTGFLVAELPYWVRAAGVLVVAVSLTWEVFHGVPLARGYGVKAVEIDASGRWFVDSGDGPRPVRLLPSSRVWTRILYLRFETQGRRFWLFLPADAVRRTDYRRLQTHLRATAS